MDRRRTDDQPEDEAPAEAPFRVRDVFAFRRPAKPAVDEETTPEAPPLPTEPPAIPAQAASAARRTERPGGGHHFPNWWDQDKTLRAYPARPEATPCAHPSPHEVRAKPTGTLVAYWCAACETQLDVPEGFDELEELDEEVSEDEDEEQVEKQSEGGYTVPASIRRRWSVKGSGKTKYVRPAYGRSPTPKSSLVEAWATRSPKTRHLLYNGIALGAGFAFGVPQFFTAEVAYLVDTYGSWTDFYVVVWYAVALGIAVMDYRSRNWWPLFALGARIPLVSLVIGVLLYGAPIDV
ncbi:hypothetical protein [Streptomyces sp. NPDC058548]|uniref:hypothetical protein n=1 Tax=Streptomyces sp. NPDC058548 TaxID=3346545 RepID=UPI003658881A